MTGLWWFDDTISVNDDDNIVNCADKFYVVVFFLISRDSTNAVCHAIEASLLHGLKGSSIDKVCFSYFGIYSLYVSYISSI